MLAGDFGATCSSLLGFTPKGRERQLVDHRCLT